MNTQNVIVIVSDTYRYDNLAVGGGSGSLYRQG